VRLQVVTDVDGSAQSGVFKKDPIKPIGGNIMAHASTTRLCKCLRNMLCNCAFNSCVMLMVHWSHVLTHTIILT